MSKKQIDLRLFIATILVCGFVLFFINLATSDKQSEKSMFNSSVGSAPWTPKYPYYKVELNENEMNRCCKQNI